jgi:hypothetical protein
MMISLGNSSGVSLLVSERDGLSWAGMGLLAHACAMVLSVLVCTFLFLLKERTLITYLFLCGAIEVFVPCLVEGWLCWLVRVFRCSEGRCIVG